MMKKMMNWVLAATLFCGTMAFMTGCKEAKAQESDSKPKVVSTELIRTSQSCLTTSRDAPNWWL